MKIQDLNVLELASVLAGPQVGTFFAEMGAEVIKVENKLVGGDVTRNWKLPNEPDDSSISAYYASTNSGKDSLMLDFTKQDDLDQVRRLIEASDIVIANFKPGDAEKFGLHYERVKSWNSKILYGEISGFGPSIKRSAFDVILQAETGYISMNGSDLKQVAKLPIAFIDLFAAHQLKTGLLTALLEKQLPARVHVSLYESAIASLANQASNYLMEGHIPKPMGTQHPNIAPYGDVFWSADELPLLFAIGSDKQFTALLDYFKAPIIDRFSTNIKRVENRDELNKFLSQYVAKEDRDKILNSCQERAIPAGGIYDLKEVFNNPMAQNMVVFETMEGHDTQKVRTVAFSISS